MVKNKSEDTIKAALVAAPYYLPIVACQTLCPRLPVMHPATDHGQEIDNEDLEGLANGWFEYIRSVS
jgi:hypothetical protein